METLWLRGLDQVAEAGLELPTKVTGKPQEFKQGGAKSDVNLTALRRIAADLRRQLSGTDRRRLAEMLITTEVGAFTDDELVPDSGPTGPP